MPHPRQTRARPYGLPVEGEGAWLIVSTSWALKGAWSQAVPSSHVIAQFPWSTRPAFRASGHAHGHGYRAAVLASPLGRHQGTPHTRLRYGRQGARAHVTVSRALRPAAEDRKSVV